MEKAYFVYTGSNSKGKVIAPLTGKALWDFCQQEPEFDQAVEQKHVPFNECIDAVASTIGQSCSDIDVFARAVKFYFSGATISVSMTINMSGEIEAASEKKPYTKPEVIETPRVSSEEPAPKKITLDLDNLLDF